MKLQEIEREEQKKKREQSPKRKSGMQRIVHFEIYTNDPEAVQPFYSDVFGWKFKEFEGGPIEYWLVTTGEETEPGINGGMSGGDICVPKMAIPKMGWLAYGQDPAGNVFGIMEPDPNAE